MENLPSLESLSPLIGQLTFGGLAGFVSGYALKKVGKILAFSLGILFIVLQALAYFGFIEIKWTVIESRVQVNSQTVSALWQQLVQVLVNNLPFAGAFIPGLLLGLKVG